MEYRRGAVRMGFMVDLLKLEKMGVQGRILCGKREVVQYDLDVVICHTKSMSRYKHGNMSFDRIRLPTPQLGTELKNREEAHKQC
jgi:hypothetical protein